MALLEINSIIFVNGKAAGGLVVSPNSAQISMVNPFTSGYVFYTLNGTTPTTNSTPYSGAFTVSNTVTVQALCLDPTQTQSVLSPQVLVQIIIPPKVAISTNNVVLASGSTLQLSATASGSSPLTYQWWRNSAPIAGATGTSYNTNSVTTNNSGSYYVTASNPYGVATSAVASVTVYVPVSITAQPSNQAAPFNGTVTLSVSATSYPAPSYEWLFNGANVSGATSSALTISKLQLTNTGPYTVLVSNPYSSQLSQPGTVSMSPSIISPFTGATANEGQPVALYVGAIGSGTLDYQWFFNGFAVGNATNAIYSFASVQATNAGLYSVVVSSPFGQATNEPALLTVNLPAPPTNIVVVSIRASGSVRGPWTNVTAWPDIYLTNPPGNGFYNISIHRK